MAKRDRRGGDRSSRKEGFEGRDLLIGRPEPPTATGKADADSSTTPPRESTQMADADDNSSRETHTRLAAIESRMKSLEDKVDSRREADDALARATVVLTQAVEEDRAAFREAMALLAGRDGEAAAAARVLAEGMDEHKKQGEAIDRRLDEVGQRAENAGQMLEKMIQAAEGFTDRLRFLSDTISREIRDRRWRRWLKGLILTAGAVFAITLGALVQRETFFLTYGDSRHGWNAYVAEHHAPTLAACASMAERDQTRVACVVDMDPSLSVTIPSSGVRLRKVPTEGLVYPETNP